MSVLPDTRADAPTRPATARGPVNPRRRPLPRHALLLLPAGAALLAGLDAALQLLDLPRPVTAARLPDVHGVLMVLGFLATLISLERAVALGRRAGMLAPALLGTGGILLLTPAGQVGRLVLVAGAVAMVAVYVPLWRRQRDEAVLTQALGAVLAVGAAALWAGGVEVPVLLPWLAGFVVLTIAGERVELARLSMGPSAGPTIVLLATTFAAAVGASLLWPVVGLPLLGAVTLVLVGWLAAQDVARRTVRSTGLARFAALGMLAGYVWLAVAATVWLLSTGTTAGSAYDAVVHATFLGFAMSMVMAHAPVILPAVLRRPLPYHPALLVPLALLHASLALRIWVGDGLGSQVAWRTGGALNIVALLLFVGTAAWSAVRAARSTR